MMRRILLVGLGLALLGAPSMGGVWGVDDQVLASTLIVPFFEVGINPATHPQNTLPVVYSANSGQMIHWEIWSIDGESTDNLFGNVMIDTLGTWSGNVYSLIAAQASASDLALLTDGPFYRGFMTIDLVTEASTSTPFSMGYPFAEDNSITGYVYYTRLTEGSANGLPMIPLEYIGHSPTATLRDFYGGAVGDGREEIDTDARSCAAQLSQGDPCIGNAADTISVLRARIFFSPPLEGDSRIIVFTWTPRLPTVFGPSVHCATAGCATTYRYRRFGGDGTELEDYQLSLPHVVNIIEPAGSEISGEAIILDVADPLEDLQVFIFSFNSAAPPAFPGLNWDAIFVGNVTP